MDFNVFTTEKSYRSWQALIQGQSLSLEDRYEVVHQFFSPEVCTNFLLAVASGKDPRKPEGEAIRQELADKGPVFLSAQPAREIHHAALRGLSILRDAALEGSEAYREIAALEAFTWWNLGQCDQAAPLAKPHADYSYLANCITIACEEKVQPYWLRTS